MPDTFFINYTVGDPIENEEEFDADEEEEEIKSISENRRAKIKKKVRKKIAKKLNKICNRLEKRLNRIQKRLEKHGIEMEGLGEGFLKHCIVDDGGDDEDDEDDGREDGDKKRRKVTICHTPHDEGAKQHTIQVGKEAARAHLAHGDTLGKCEADDDDGGDTDTAPPVITNKIATPSATSTAITWTTDEESTSEVEYATESLTTATSTSEVSDETLVTSHSVELSDLDPETTYFFVAKSTDAAGNTATTSEMTFTTLAAPEEPEADTTPPVISSILAAPTSTAATITWTTDEDSTSKVEFATESLGTATSTQEVIDNTLVTSHSLEISGLATSTLYFYYIESKDAENNTATSTEQTFTTL